MYGYPKYFQVKVKNLCVIKDEFLYLLLISVGFLSHQQSCHSCLHVAIIFIIHSNVICPFDPSSFKWPFFLQVSTRNVLPTSSVPCKCHIFHVPHSSWFDLPNKNFVAIFPPVSCYSVNRLKFKSM